MLASYRAQPRTWLARSAWKVSRRCRTAQCSGSGTSRPARFRPSPGTGSPDYPRQLQALFKRMPVRLLAGEQSLAGWDVPAWAEEMAEGVTVVSGCGHLMMLDDPAGPWSAGGCDPGMARKAEIGGGHNSKPKVRPSVLAARLPSSDIVMWLTERRSDHSRRRACGAVSLGRRRPPVPYEVNRRITS